MAGARSRDAGDVILEVRDLTVRFERDGGAFEPVGGVDLTVRRGETLGVVGESGSGKSMTGLAIMGMLPSGGRITSGSVRLNGQDLVGLPETQLQAMRGNEIAMIFQDSMTSLNPTKTIGEQVAEPVRAHRGSSRRDALQRAEEVLALVGIPNPRERLTDYPHQLSGGMRQRVMIAMALACEPKVVIADEPTTALDVTIQAQVLTVLDDLKTRLGMGIILITHDIGVIAGRADRVSVMYAGKTAERASTDQLFAQSRHHYTRDLLASIPLLTQDRASELYTIGGHPPDLSDPPAGCRYAPRCQAATEQCHAQQPGTTTSEPGHQYACWNPASTSDLARIGTSTGALNSGAPTAPDPTTSGSAFAEPVLKLENLVKEYPLRPGRAGTGAGRVHALSGVSLQILPGETFGLVGESGCGKSTLGRTIVGLERVTSGRILLNGTDITSERERRRAGGRRALQMMFQDPYASLDPRMKIAKILQEPLNIAGGLPRPDRASRVLEMLELVGLPATTLAKVPHELSGGQRQRVGLARALILGPQVLVADEPVSALDVSIRSQVLNLMKRSSTDIGLSSLVISHDLAVVKYLADRIGVMYLGKLVEQGAGGDIYARPAHPYTAGLIAAIPEPDPVIERAKPPAGVLGELPSAVEPPSGCRYRTRCPLATERCGTEEPAFVELSPTHKVACHYPLTTDDQRQAAVSVVESTGPRR